MGDTTTRQRLAAILAADVSGYSRLMACDEPGTVSALDAAREVFARHTRAQQGRVIDMAGDSVLAVFETAASAVGASLAVQNEIAERTAGATNEISELVSAIQGETGQVEQRRSGQVADDGEGGTGHLADTGQHGVADVIGVEVHQTALGTEDQEVFGQLVVRMAIVIGVASRAGDLPEERDVGPRGASNQQQE